MEITTSPGARFGWEGQTLEFTVSAQGASGVSAAKETPDGLQVRVGEVRQVGGGVQADVTVEVRDGAMFCDFVPVDVRSSAGTVEQAKLAVAAGPSFMMPTFGIVGALAAVAAAYAIRSGGWAGWLFGILAGLVGLLGLATFAFMIWARYTGLPWGFAG